MSPSSKPSLLALSLLLLCGTNLWAVNPSQGLWVGEVSLNAVNEATGAVGNSNTYEFTDPQITTPTSDTAFLRLILHVNGAGQVRLLKSVAVVEGGPSANGGKNILLITDPSLYADHPGIAKRIATAFFDFGDQQAVTAVQKLIDTATTTAVARASTGETKAVIEPQILTALNAVVDHADVNAAYLDRGTGASSFLTTSFFSVADVQAIADQVASLIAAGTKSSSDIQRGTSVGDFFPADPLGGNFATLMTTAVTLRDRSFYGDTRGIDAIVGIVVAAAQAVDATASGASLAEKQTNARLAAEGARHNAADVTQAFNRFIASSKFTDLLDAIPEAAAQAAIASQLLGVSEAEIVTAVQDALLANVPVGTANTEAATILATSLWSDNRARLAVDALVNSAAKAAAAAVIGSQVDSTVKKAAEDAVKVTFDSIQAAPIFAGAPSTEYSGFVTAAAYRTAAATAARTAANEASFQYAAGVTKPADLSFLTNKAVTKALVSARNQAAVLPQSSLPLSGSLTAGGSLNGTIYLPALAPTNPFMHRRHPDHTEGYAITRRISMTVNVPGADDSQRAGYGVSRISGTYREEIFGLHKPLGNQQDIGLKTQGTFTLNRLTSVGSLNF